MSGAIALADADPDDGTGFVADHVDGVAITATLFRAARLLADRRRRPPLTRRIMQVDWSWGEPAVQYLGLYGRLRRRH